MAGNGKMTLFGGLGRAWLSRPFRRDVRRRILLVFYQHELAEVQFHAFLRYASRFGAGGTEFRAVSYASLNPATLAPDLDALFLQAPYDPADGELEGVLAAIRLAKPDLSIAFFDWAAPADIRFADRVAPWVNTYVKKSLLRDRSAYSNLTNGHTNLTDHYTARFSLPNPPPTWANIPDIIERLVLGPAFSTGPNLIARLEKKEPPAGERTIDLHARIATRGTPWYAAMRQEAKAAVDGRFPDLTIASQGNVPKAKFMQELERSKLCFSPFGYGEVCWRDFEAIAMGAVLVKPDMSHLDCDPDIYRPFETYIPVRWDFSDLEEQVRAALADPPKMRRMAERAFAVVHDHLCGPALEQLVDRLVEARA